MAQNEDARAEIAYEVLRTLRTSNIASVVDRLNPLLHIDPVEKLPPEIIFEVFSYLDAASLLTASLASHAWRQRVLDPRLWKKLYVHQGWAIATAEVKAFEAPPEALVRHGVGKPRSLMRSDYQPQRSLRPPKRRTTHARSDSHASRASRETLNWREQHGKVEADADATADPGDQEMIDAPPGRSGPSLSPPRASKRQSQDGRDDMDFQPNPVRPRYSHELDPSLPCGPVEPALIPSLIARDRSGAESINWAYLYKQRRRLEDNWTRGRFTNFQLPRSDHPEEAHTECVYAIQFFGKWLVSGSRDQTLRVWDLETRRLRGKPLTGHTQSVLCLQFDPTEHEDVIVSGSSDTSVIVWRFSTGEKICHIQGAHAESVLNLRFNRRYLVTCSKDRKIKVWNRRELTPLSPDYPRWSRTTHARYPSYIVDLSSIPPSELEDELARRQIQPLRPYSLLLTLEGHSAAVNAIQIDKERVVSASGDRTIKIWDVKNGRCVRTLAGHSKGIACVQYDSRRIVSGSSDNSIRIFDPATGAEVATLESHKNLVRTLQADFSDQPGSEEDYIRQARAAEHEYMESVRNGAIPGDPFPRAPQASRRPGPAELGPARITFGAMLPPGGAAASGPASCRDRTTSP